MTKDNAKAPEQAVDQQQVLKDLLALGKKNGRLSLKEIAERTQPARAGKR